MKKILAIALSLMMVFALCACGQKEEPAEETAGEDDPSLTEALEATGALGLASLGGFDLNAVFDAPAMPEEAAAAFDNAMAGLMGAKHEPMAYLGSQVVAGANYKYLCKTTVPGDENALSYNVITVYHDLQGADTVLGIEPFDIWACMDPEAGVAFDPAGLAGGWNIDNACGGPLPAEAQAAFDTAVGGLTGVGYEPLALLGTQVVAGVNYAILCKAQTVTAEPASALAVMTVYADLEGGAAPVCICGFPY